MSETIERVGVEFHVVELERVQGCGRLLAIATTPCGLQLQLRGCQVRRSVLPPPPLPDALGAAIIEAVEEGIAA